MIRLKWQREKSEWQEATIYDVGRPGAVTQMSHMTMLKSIVLQEKVKMLNSSRRKLNTLVFLVHLISNLLIFFFVMSVFFLTE